MLVGSVLAVCGLRAIWGRRRQQHCRYSRLAAVRVVALLRVCANVLGVL
jgi:hypothetical protein